jgi:putative redox protein
MTSKPVYLDWNPNDFFTVKDSGGHQFPINMGRGVGASDLLTMSLIGCSSYDVVEILGKQRQELIRLEVRAEAAQDEDPPWRFRKIHIHYRATGKGLDPEKVRKAVQLSEEKYCSVYATLRDAVEITHEVEVVENE